MFPELIDFYFTVGMHFVCKAYNGCQLSTLDDLRTHHNTHTQHTSTHTKIKMKRTLKVQYVGKFLFIPR